MEGNCLVGDDAPVDPVSDLPIAQPSSTVPLHRLTSLFASATSSA
jgi:hypothetical protein